ncbi:putative flavonol 3-O-glucosyltransferase [Rosa chinensis]|uniref:Putative flavonol 3-O-glucosyltransferase n=1 Tax=Rosa chinensis TaxID=74649 RepID=A0A2P6PLZ3_ROSCH|nr:putative flavonol 3-O-glucosyltransferase [Rosa chinensis]
MKMDLTEVSDSKPLVIPNLPHEFKIPGNQIPDFMKQECELKRFGQSAAESERSSFGVVVNSFYEIEPAYADHYRNVLGIKAWHIGPTFLCHKEIEDKARRGLANSIDGHECQKWLDSKKPNSVIYVSFGSVVKFDDAQLMEIALGLEASGFGGERVKSEAIEKVVKQIMVGEEAEEMRSRAKKHGEVARRSVVEGGSSYNDLNGLIAELRIHTTASSS